MRAPSSFHSTAASPPRERVVDVRRRSARASAAPAAGHRARTRTARARPRQRGSRDVPRSPGQHRCAPHCGRHAGRPRHGLDHHALERPLAELAEQERREEPLLALRRASEQVRELSRRTPGTPCRWRRPRARAACTSSSSSVGGRRPGPADRERPTRPRWTPAAARPKGRRRRHRALQDVLGRGTPREGASSRYVLTLRPHRPRRARSRPGACLELFHAYLIAGSSRSHP